MTWLPMADPADSRLQLSRMIKQAMAGKDYRLEANRLKIHYTTLYEVARGYPKSEPTMRRIATGLGLDPETVVNLAESVTGDYSPSEDFRNRLLQWATDNGEAVVPMIPLVTAEALHSRADVDREFPAFIEWYKETSNLLATAPRLAPPAARLGPEMIAVAKRLGYEGDVTLRRFGGRDRLSHADVDQILIDLEKDLRAEMEERQRQR